MIRNIQTLLLLISGLTLSSLFAEENEVDPGTTAGVLAQKYILVDTHIDVPYRLEEEWADVTQRLEDGDFDYWRAQEGGLNVPFMSIYTPAGSEQEGTSFSMANRLIDRVEALAGREKEKFSVVKSSREAEKARELGLMALAMGMENGSPLEGKLENIEFFKNRGISYITLTHSESNHLSDSSYDDNRQWNGLSPFGKEAIAEMNRLGMMIDVSHLSDEAFWQVMELSRAPVIASHSSARHFTPGFERNMGDEMIKAMAKKGGIIMINFGSSFVTQEAHLWYESMDAAREAYLDRNDYDEHGSEAQEFRKKYLEENPFPFASLDDVVKHFDHVIGLVGVKHVGIGSDYDGVGDSLPTGLKDVSQYPNLVQKFLEQGYSHEDIEDILGGNLMRVWRSIESHAEHQAGQAAAASP
jgi:membrane dipeptidase